MADETRMRRTRRIGEVSQGCRHHLREDALARRSARPARPVCQDVRRGGAASDSAARWRDAVGEMPLLSALILRE